MNERRYVDSIRYTLVQNHLIPNTLGTDNCGYRPKNR